MGRIGKGDGEVVRMVWFGGFVLWVGCVVVIEGVRVCYDGLTLFGVSEEGSGYWVRSLRARC